MIAVIQIFYEKNADTIQMLQLLLNSVCTETKTFLLLVLPCQQGAEGAQEAGARTSTVDPNCPEGYPMQYDDILSNKSCRKRRRGMF